jgi:FMN phosphatase YigB (HAD superfamily)
VHGALEVFNAIADRVPVGVITNGFLNVQRRKLERFEEVSRRLSAVIISEEVGYMKPHRQLFEIAQSRAGVPGKHILYVGDSLHSDVDGALAAGWHMAWFAPHRQASPESDRLIRFGTWSELPTLLGRRLAPQEV